MVLDRNVRHALRSVEESGAALDRSSAPIQFLVGQHVTLEEADLAVEFDRYGFRGAFLVAEADHGILGRNILSALDLHLYGPRLECSIGEG